MLAENGLFLPVSTRSRYNLVRQCLVACCLDFPIPTHFATSSRMKPPWPTTITTSRRIPRDEPQHLGKFMNWLPLLPFVLFFAWLFLFALRYRKPCPDCGKPLPSFQSPLTKTKRQWIEGGFLCNHCGCESDISGNKVAPETHRKLRPIFIGFALVALTTIPAVAMLVVLLQP